MCLLNAIFVSECSGDMCLVKNESSMYLDDYGAKELVIICDRVHFSLVRMNGPNTASSLLKSRDEKPRDTDTGNEHQVRRLTPVLTITGAVSDCERYQAPKACWT